VDARRWLQAVRDIVFAWILIGIIGFFGDTWIRQQLSQQVWDNTRLLYNLSLITLIFIAEGSLLFFTRDVWRRPGYFNWSCRLLIGGLCLITPLIVRIGVNASLLFVLPTPAEIALLALYIAGMAAILLSIGILGAGAVIASITKRRQRRA
jgi:hypothetical protein